MEQFIPNPTPPQEQPKMNGCLVILLVGLVILLIGWSMCGQM